MIRETWTMVHEECIVPCHSHCKVVNAQEPFHTDEKIESFALTATTVIVAM